MQQKPYPFLGDYILNKFITTDSADEEWDVFSPADLKDKVISPQSHFAHVDQAVGVAKVAFEKWRHTSLADRIQALMRLKEVFLARQENLIQVIARETGKPLWEAKTEAAALPSKITTTIDHSLKLIAEERVANALPNVEGVIRYKPRGVMAVLGPFNFPAHLPNGHIIPALISGNTVIFKPSEKTPAVGQVYAECVAEAQLPLGVFNLLQGKAEVGKRLAAHESVDGVLFTGSYNVGLRIKQETINHYWKLLALEMGGKNVSIIWEDADLEKAVYETLVGSYMTAGQRCSCTSKIILHPKIKDQFVDTFYRSAKKLSVGHWSENKFMGPLISAESVENYIRFQEIAKREGAECVMRGKTLELPWPGHYVTPSIYLVNKWNPESVYQNTEIFGPNVGIYTTDDFNEALTINNSSGFGLVLALFSKNKALYEKAVLDSKVGLLNWNRTTNGASSRLPFGGLGKSGNDRPSGHFAIQYCTVPVASLEDTTLFDSKNELPGINYSFKE